MTRARPNGMSPGHPRWEDTAPMPRLDTLQTPADAAVCAVAPTATAQRRTEPGFTQVAQGLEIRELEGQTVFDQLFGNGAPTR
jgi:hypothetical protein